MAQSMEQVQVLDFWEEIEEHEEDGYKRI